PEMWRRDVAERVDRLSRFTCEELRAIEDGIYARFRSPEHHVLPKTNPERPVIKELTRMLHGVGFSDDEIVGLIDDGEDQTSSPKALRAAKDRVRSRREK